MRRGGGRTLSGLALLLLVALAPRAEAFQPAVCGADEPAAPGHAERLVSFAERIGLTEIRAFVGVASTIFRTGRAPGCYLTKEEAEAQGWRPGGDLWRVAPGAAVGGYVFHNWEQRLPLAPEGHYRVLDLDYAGGRRGAKRLVYVRGSAGSWRQWVTLDHYETFLAVPAPP